LHKELARASRDGVPLSLLLVDVDDFRTFNDEFGHEAGDQALRRVAELLAANSRPFDVVARYGGEEFALILPRAGATAALSVAERMRRTIGAAPWGGRPVTVSIGAGTSGGESDGALLIAQAERALFRAKARGRNQVVHSSR
jgi:diguanylate cyclase (GGDEF)-like protein